MTAAQPLRVLVVEDNDLTRLGTVTLIGTQSDMQVVGEAADGVEGLELYEKLQPDVVILDLRLPRLDGNQVLSALAGREPRARVLVLTYHEGDDLIFRALKAGALGYVGKGVRAGDFLSALRQVAAGKRYVPEALGGRLAERMLQPDLSGRERQVLERLARGESNRQIAGVLELSENTVAMYVRKVMDKLGARSRTEAVTIAMQRGILPSP